MRSHLRSVAKRKVSDFLLREEGMVGNRSAFATAALVSTTAIAMTLLVTPDATAGWCAGNPCNLNFCCTANWVNYVCRNHDPGGAWHCWAP